MSPIVYSLTGEKQLDYSTLFLLERRQGSELHELEAKNQGAETVVYVVMLLKAKENLKMQIHEVDHHTVFLLCILVLLFAMMSIMAEQVSEFKQNIISRGRLQAGHLGKRTPKI